jgi:lysophospholipase L1-like esterase
MKKSFLIGIMGLLLIGLTTPSFIPKYGKGIESHKNTYLALGDAYVLGEGIDEHERWPILLESSLRKHDEKLHINYPYFVAHKSWTINDLSKRLDEEEFDKHYDLISIQIGVNDEYKKHTITQFTADFRALLAKVQKLTGERPGRIFVISIPDWSATPFAKKHDSAALQAVEENIGKFNNVLKKEVIAIGGHYVDITDISKKVATDPSYTCPDGLHPSGVQYKAWTDRMEPTVLKALHTHR